MMVVEGVLAPLNLLQTIKAFKDIVRSLDSFCLNQNSPKNTFPILVAYTLKAYKILYLTIYFVLKRSLSICHIIQGHF